MTISYIIGIQDPFRCDSHMIPILLAFSVTITLGVYLSIKAYQVYKRIQNENGKDKQVSKNKLDIILQQLKPMITLLVTILGRTTIAVVIPTIYRSATIVEDTSLVKHFIYYQIYPTQTSHCIHWYMVYTSERSVSHCAGG